MVFCFVFAFYESNGQQWIEKILTWSFTPETVWKHCNMVLCVHACMVSHVSHVRLFASPWTVARQAPLSTGFSRQDSWSGLPCPPPGDLPDPGTEPTSLMSPVLAGRFHTTNAT